jgi:hypothetical protein
MMMATKRCPYCGRLNTSSDQFCYNCENPLVYADDMGEPLPLDPLPDMESYRLAREDDEEAAPRPARLREGRRRQPSLLQLWVSGLARKVFLLCLSLGGFFLMALLAIWLTYDNFAAAMVVAGIFAFCVLLSLFLPDVALSRRHGKKAVAASLLSNLFLLAVVIPLLLWYLRARGYISGTGFLLLPLLVASVSFLMIGVLLSWGASRRAGR